ncbi:uncharacterized protein LOC100215593 [Anopheles sinensis]|uniref:Uncharacterized protein LOC100215593 n=1 Tax=Anopheles sinensis TaxID=74873 RepID=A0A084WEL1_ANOSI|nr:uncharacterized protein LOC100215593 [Anopheles sinensis]
MHAGANNTPTEDGLSGRFPRLRFHPVWANLYTVPKRVQRRGKKNYLNKCRNEKQQHLLLEQQAMRFREEKLAREETRSLRVCGWPRSGWVALRCNV